MAALQNKIDFAVVFTVRNANSNGDPLDGNRPRTTYDGYGEVSDVCIKRKVRNRMIDEGEAIFVQSDDRRAPGDKNQSLKDRADSCEELKACYTALTKKLKKGEKSEVTRDDYAAIACKTWYDVRAFGQVFAFKKGKDDASDAISIGIRGPVTIQSAFSTEPVDIISTQITKSVNLETGEDPHKKAADTMGMKHRVAFGVYQTFGSINVQAAQKTGFSEEDAERLKEALRTLFRNDATSARPDGSMEVVKVIWWKHNCANGQYSAAKVHRSLKVTSHGTDVPEVAVDAASIPGLDYEELDGE